MRAGFPEIELEAMCENYGTEFRVMLIPRERDGKRRADLYLHDGQEEAQRTLSRDDLIELRDAATNLLKWLGVES